jgi:hypothetical protein
VDRTRAAPGRFDDGYLASIARTARMLEAHRLFPLIDLHQEMVNERFLGEGFPAWAVQADGLAASPRRGFPANYSIMPALSRAYENFWRNNSPVPGGSASRTGTPARGRTWPRTFAATARWWASTSSTSRSRGSFPAGTWRPSSAVR